MAEAIELSVVLPAFREGRSLVTLVPTLLEALAEFAAPFEVLVVDTQRPLDDTRDVCGRHGIRYVHRQGGDRYGDAVRTGIARARGEYVLFMDADGSHDPSSIAAMWRRRRDFAIVIGSRYVAGGRTQNGFILITLSRALCSVVRSIFGLRLMDVTTSFRLYRGSMLRALVLEANGFDILQEILVKALTGLQACEATEVPVTFARRTDGKSKRRLFALGVAYVTTFIKLKAGTCATRNAPSR